MDAGENSKNNEVSIAVEVNTEQLDAAIEKANHLVELLREVEQIINSLSISKN